MNTRLLYKIKILLLIMIMPGATAWVNAETQAAGNEKKNRIIISPLLFYSPETRFAFGAAGSYIFHSPGDSTKVRPSSLSPVLIYTLEKQLIASLTANIYFKNSSFNLTGSIGYKKFPTRFFGIGTNALEADEENYTPQNFFLSIALFRDIGSGFHVGIKYHLLDWEIKETEPDGQLVGGFITGSEPGTISGLGFIFRRDTRDSIYFPRRGEWMDFDLTFYRQFLGSNYKYTYLTLDLRQYFPLFSRSVLAVRALLKHQFGTVPFIELSQLGGNDLLRGYYEGRFRDKNLAAVQTEYRFPFSRRFGLVGFSEIGNVAEKLGNLDKGKLKISYGAGIRYKFLDKEDINLRLDIGMGEDGVGFYFGIFEAF